MIKEDSTEEKMNKRISKASAPYAGLKNLWRGPDILLNSKGRAYLVQCP